MKRHTMVDRSLHLLWDCSEPAFQTRKFENYHDGALDLHLLRAGPSDPASPVATASIAEQQHSFALSEASIRRCDAFDLTGG